jgi:phage-related protein
MYVREENSNHYWRVARDRSGTRRSVPETRLQRSRELAKHYPLTEYSNYAIIQLRQASELNSDFTIEYVELPNGRAPARDFVDSLDDKAAARIDAFIDRLRIYGNRMQGKFVKKLTGDIFELRVKQFDRIFRVLFFYQPGMLIVITSGFQKKTEQTPQGELTRAGQLRKLWMKYRNRYTGSQKERDAILKELGL